MIAAAGGLMLVGVWFVVRRQKGGLKAHFDRLLCKKSRFFGRNYNFEHTNPFLFSVLFTFI
jgi:hypothetical protein